MGQKNKNVKYNTNEVDIREERKKEYPILTRIRSKNEKAHKYSEEQQQLQEANSPSKDAMIMPNHEYQLATMKINNETKLHKEREVKQEIP